MGSCRIASELYVRLLASEVFGFLKLVCELCLAAAADIPYCVLFQWQRLAFVELLYMCDC